MQQARMEVMIKEQSDHQLQQVVDTGGDTDHRQLPMMDDQLCDGETYEKVRSLAIGNAVVVFSYSDCCMCHVVKQLLFGLGVGPTIIELDEEKGGREMQAVLCQMISSTTTSTAAARGGGGGVAGVGAAAEGGDERRRRQQLLVPLVFVGGKFLGGLETVMSCHINGTLIPLLKDAGALWL